MNDAEAADGALGGKGALPARPAEAWLEGVIQLRTFWHSDPESSLLLRHAQAQPRRRSPPNGTFAPASFR